MGQDGAPNLFWKTMTVLDQDAEQFFIRDEGRIICQPSLTFVFFAPLLAETARLSEPLEAFLHRFGAEVAWHRSDFHQMHPRRILKPRRAGLFDKMREGFLNFKRGTCLTLHSGPVRDEWSPPFFTFWNTRPPKSNMFLNIQLPLKWLADEGIAGVDAFLDEILGASFPFTFGYVGIGLMYNPSSIRDPYLVGPHFHAWLHAYPGLMNPCAGTQSNVVEHGLPDIGWITLLGPELVERAGGTAAIHARIAADHADEIVMRPLARGALAIRAGQAPKLGNAAQGDRLALQSAVGNALDCLVDHTKNRQVVIGFPKILDCPETLRWANRFFSGQ